ncbi:ECF transporter S component [Clostridium sp. D2Q-14]|uniref:ECF transporter S component n=1 Tax=Anaeromonas gelatinilytica TaxID=2683194 RepID=UPI00193C67D4|nr:ECF transporter S component [Anaeromonas gelatinilytica]MBS4534631.1 ECF transporter S component [Anaeromonas gelatinilytica]
MQAVKKKVDVRYLTKTAVLSVLAFLIMFIEVPMWFAPPFLKVDFSDIPALIGAFALGPMTGVVIELLKNILHIALKGTTTVGVGELANFIVGSIFVCIASIMYYKNKNFKSAIIGLILGTIAMTLVAAIANYLFLLPFYAKFYGTPIESFVEMGAAVNKYVSDVKSLVIFAITPFNILKGIMISVVTIPLYKRISPLLHK